MPWERTLLDNYVGELDAPTKSVKAYLSNLIFQMLYAMPTLPPLIGFRFLPILFPFRFRQKKTETGYKNAVKFWDFCNEFMALTL